MIRPAPTHPQAVVFDLFGTLIDAPTEAERANAAVAISAVTQAPPVVVEQVLIDSWSERHDGRLPTLASLGNYLWQRCSNDGSAPPELLALLLRLASARLSAPPEVLSVIERLRKDGIRIAVLSDASADVAEAWPQGWLGKIIDVAIFSCQAGAVKPTARLYFEVLDQLGVASPEALYCGDGGGDELRGATAAGLSAVHVDRRGPTSAIAFGDQPWPGPSISSVEHLPAFLSFLPGRRQ